MTGEVGPLGPNPGPIGLTDTVAAAGRKAMWVHLDRMLAREAAIQDPDQPDELRRYRVATRRLRAALRMFRFAFPEAETRPLRRGLSDLAGAVGAIRDLDNRIADLNRWAIERGGDGPAAVAVLSDAWARDRGRGIRQLGKRLASPRHRRLLEALASFVQATPRGDADQAGAARTISDRLASLLWAAYEDVHAFAPVVSEANLATIHELRISTKRLRDDLDFLADVLPADRAWLLERLVALQDHLGALNDATVAAGAVQAFLDHRRARLAPVERTEITGYLDSREREVTTLRQSLEGPWRPVAGLPFARRLGRLVVVRPSANQPPGS
jgi:CHAD domain-containing protein